MTRLPTGFGVLLRVLPTEFRDRHREQILDLVASYSEGQSRLFRFIIWFRAAVDVIRVGVALRLGITGHDRLRLLEGQAKTAPFDSLAQDVRYSVRGLKRDYGLSALAVLIVGLGIGASSTVFSVGNALLLRPLPFDEPERLVWISNGEWGRGQSLSAITTQVFRLWDLQNESRTLSDVAGYCLFDWAGDHTLTGDGDPERLTRLRVTGNLFPLLGVRPMIGRLFTSEETLLYGPGAIILSHGLWLRRFGADPDIVGRSLTLNGEPVNVVGVLPASFDFNSIFPHDNRIDFVAPFPLTERTNQQGNTLALIGRLQPGATVEAAQAEASQLATRSYDSGGRTNEFEPVVGPLREHVSGGFRPAVVLLGGAVTLVMLIVCANLSNLLLARGAGREREIAIRAALGGERARLIRQMLTESGLLALAGGALGLVLALVGTNTLASLNANIQLLDQVRVDGAALTFTIVAAVVAGLIFGLTPAVRLSAVALNESLKEGGRSFSLGRRLGWTRNALVVAEVALACVLLVGSGLLIRSFYELLNVDLGFEPRGTVTLRVDPQTRFETFGQQTAYYDDVLRRVRSAPGVQAAGLTDVLPVAFNRRWALSAGDNRAVPYVRMVSEEYLRAMGLTLVAGRDFSTADDSSLQHVAIVNELLAEELWPDESPIDKTVVMGRHGSRGWQVVGVVKGMRHLTPEQAPAPEIFFHIRQANDFSRANLIVRGERSLPELVTSVRDALSPLSASLPINDFRIVQEIIDESTAPRRFLVLLLSGFACFALLLAALGTYGVISYSVGQRTQEIGIRTALGASPTDLRHRVLFETLRLAAFGLAVGLAASWMLTMGLQSQLFGVSAADPITYAVVPVMMVVVAGLAGYLPARRASNLDPVNALRN